jgi:DNA-directed RNA polymerase subunit RPC12/RpoP
MYCFTCGKFVLTLEKPGNYPYKCISCKEKEPTIDLEKMGWVNEIKCNMCKL